LERLRQRFDDPQPGDAFARVDGQLARAIVARGRRRDDLAYPIGGELEEGLVGQALHPLAPPAGEVGDEHVSVEMELGLVDDPPTAARLAKKGTIQLA